MSDSPSAGLEKLRVSPNGLIPFIELSFSERTDIVRHVDLGPKINFDLTKPVLERFKIANQFDFEILP